MNEYSAESKRVYVRVMASFDEQGQMRPRTFVWKNGRQYEIDRVIDVRPSHSQKAGSQGDRYTIMVCGKQRYLFFEHNPRFGEKIVGRWFMEEVS